MSYTFKTKPFDHQADVLKLSWKALNWAYFMEMGTGKSKVCIDNAGILFELGRIDTFVVVAPKGVFRNWARIEIPVHLPDRIEREMGMWSSTPKREQKKQLESFLSPNVAGNLRILVMNVEALSTGKGTR
jgi:hypothetical protein